MMRSNNTVSGQKSPEEDDQLIQDQLTQEDDQLTQEDDQLTQEDDQLTQEDDQLTQEDDQLTQEDDQLTQEDDQLTQEDDQLTQEDDLGFILVLFVFLQIDGCRWTGVDMVRGSWTSAAADTASMDAMWEEEEASRPTGGACSLR